MKVDTKTGKVELTGNEVELAILNYLYEQGVRIQGARVTRMVTPYDSGIRVEQVTVLLQVSPSGSLTYSFV